MTEGPRRILHTGSRDFGSSANVARKTEEKEGGSEDTLAERKGNLKPKNSRQGIQKVQEDDCSHLPKSHTLFSARTGGRAVWWG